MEKIRIVRIKPQDQMINGIPRWLEKMEKVIPKNRIIKIEYDFEWSVYTWNNWDIDEYMIEEELTPKDYPQYFI
jgi:hypothetical protein